MSAIIAPKIRESAIPRAPFDSRLTLRCLFANSVDKLYRSFGLCVPFAGREGNQNRDPLLQRGSSGEKLSRFGRRSQQSERNRWYEFVGQKAPNSSQVRYFFRGDRGPELEKIEKTLQEAGVSAKVQFIGLQQNPPNLRPKEFEVWLGLDYPPNS